MKVLGSRVLIMEDQKISTSEGGIIIPEQAQEKTQRGKVISTGPEALSVIYGENVLVDKYSGTPITFNGKECLLVDSDNILAIFEEGE